MAADVEPVPLVAPTTMPWFFGRYPQVDPDTLRARLELFGVSEQDFSLTWQLAEYRSLRQRQSAERASVAAAVLVFGVVPIAVDVAVSGIQPTVAEFLAGSWLWWLPVIAVVGYLVSSHLRTRVKSPGLSHALRGRDRVARHRFFRAAGLAFASGHQVVVTQNIIGLAARALFLSLQRRRWTWVSPPAVADRALRLARPLLDIEVEERAGGEALFSFLYDVVVVVIARREDLIPEVRARYGMIPRRSDTAGDRDVLYLDPMRNRGRWEVVKDFVLPLASWISLLVSVVALVVAVSR
ncbi:hypothetical protein [Kutzneria sp. NPDC051319]|uniref:hypothetical protein n=1 Tax=Kutzneria sp. NPDC051319 TaxID=3155047 RepID=UPI003437581B